MSRFRDSSRRLALCGVLAALALVLLNMGGLLPLATFCCPVLAMLCTLPVLEEYGGKTALLFYAAVSILALLLTPDKEVALLYLFLGWFPVLRPRINCTIPGKLLSGLVKLLLFAAAVSVMYSLAIFVLGMEYLAEEYTGGGQILLLVTVLLGCVIWLLFDKVLQRFTLLYRRRWRGKLFRG
ncbi:MAG: hypothetical protein E7469_02900 [Ruminococcaceae bacterium]|nr:hypothetical protein [Oscillospiraceae bacterium]